MLVRARSALALAAAFVAAAAPGAGAAAPQPTRELAALVRPHQARTAPDSDSTALARVPARAPITGSQTVLPVLAHTTDAAGLRWLKVMLPGRPNGSTGWIEQSGTVALTTNWQLVVLLGRRRVEVYRGGKLVRAFGAVVGKPSTPTPRGRFFVEESVALSARDVGAPFALALSARSNVLQEFDGGPGQIALHGLSNVGGVPGTGASHGCIRLPDGEMRWLAARIGPGDLVTIRG